MDKNEEVQPEQIEEYCRQLGLQLRDEHEISPLSFLGAAGEAQNLNESGQPIPPGLTSLEAKDKTNYECKKCDRNFANSRQFLKHKCIMKTETEKQAKSKGMKRGRKPRVKKSEPTTTEGISDEVNTERNTNKSKVESEAVIEEQFDHLSDHTYIKDDDESLNQTENTSDGKNIQCDACQLLAEIDPETVNNPNKIPCEKCQELTTSATPTVKSADDTEINEEDTKKRKYSFKTEKQNCPHCGKGFHSQKRFDKHIPVCKKNLVCPFCKKDFSANGRAAYIQYQAHYYTHVDTKPFTCQICSRGFIRKADLDRHKIIHTDNYSPQRCAQCGAVFATPENLAKHMHKHDRLPLSCKKCGQQFARQATLDKHVEICQTETSCEICGKVFKCLSKNIKSRYQEHMFIHTGQKPYKCQFCERGFRDRSTRRKHERTHTGERPYPCTVCERAFSQLRLLRNHVRTHTGEKPYSCHLCTLSFAKSCNLKYHMRVHTKEKPYSCSICFKSFTQSGTYHKHMRRHQEAGTLVPTITQLQTNTPEGELALEVDVNIPQRQVTENASVNDSNSALSSADNFSSDTISIVVDTVDAKGTSNRVHDSQISVDASQDISTEVSSQHPNGAASAIPDMPAISGEEITIIVSEGDGVAAEVAATLAAIDVDQISSILASCS